MMRVNNAVNSRATIHFHISDSSDCEFAVCSIQGHTAIDLDITIDDDDTLSTNLARKVNLATMTPRPELASTTYCLANPGNEYLVYQPKRSAAFSVELKAGTYRYEWFDPGKGGAADSGSTESSGQTREFKAPFEGDAVLYLSVQ